MLEESDELPEGTRWGSKVARIFDLDARWKVSHGRSSVVNTASSSLSLWYYIAATQLALVLGLLQLTEHHICMLSTII